MPEDTRALTNAVERPFHLLDVYAEDGVKEIDYRPDWIATISAGRKITKPGRDGKLVTYPEVSRDGTIYLSFDANGETFTYPFDDPNTPVVDGCPCPELLEALEATNYKSLTIFFPYDDLNLFVLQRIAKRSATNLEVYGDGAALTEIVIKEKAAEGKPAKVEHVTHLRGSQRYRELLRTCKVETHVLFGLARWEGTKPICRFGDGFRYYAFRFTSRNSAQAVAGRLDEIKKRATQGRLAGLPFELSINYRNVTAPDGKRRNVPIWNIDLKPPGGIELTSGNFRDIVEGALTEGARLALPAPPTYTLAQAAAENDDVDLDAFTEDVPCDPQYWRSVWYVAVKGTTLDSDDERHAFIARHTRGAFASLTRFLDQASEVEASDFIGAVGEALDAEARERIRAMVGGGRLRDVAARMDDDYYSPEHMAARRRPQPAPSAEQAPPIIEHEAAPSEPAPPAVPASPSTTKEKQVWSGNLHVLTGALGWDDPTYRLMLRNCFGVKSSTEISKEQASALCRVLQAEVREAQTVGRPPRQPAELPGLRDLGWTDGPPQDPEAESSHPTDTNVPGTAASSSPGESTPVSGEETAPQGAAAITDPEPRGEPGQLSTEQLAEYTHWLEIASRLGIDDMIPFELLPMATLSEYEEKLTKLKAAVSDRTEALGLKVTANGQLVNAATGQLF